MKRKLATIFIALVMVGTSIFGLSLLDHGDSHDRYCVAAQMQNIKCPDNSIAMVELHIAAVKDFSNAFLPEGMLLVLSLLFFIGFAYRLRFSLFLRRICLRPTFYPLEDHINRFTQAIRSWLSLFEHSPSFAMAAVR